jgi:DUF1009 family protein
METKVLTQEEIQSLKSFKEEQIDVVALLGNIEYQIQLLDIQKQKLKEEIQNQIQKQNKYAENLQQKYGEGNIDLEKGEFTPIS